MFACVCLCTLVPAHWRVQAGIGRSSRSLLQLWTQIFTPSQHSTQANGVQHSSGETARGMGCCPRCSDHRLAVTGGCASRGIVASVPPPQCSSVFWELPGSKRLSSPRVGKDNTLSCAVTLSLKSPGRGQGLISFHCCFLFLYLLKFTLFWLKIILRIQSPLPMWFISS